MPPRLAHQNAGEFHIPRLPGPVGDVPLPIENSLQREPER